MSSSTDWPSATMAAARAAMASFSATRTSATSAKGWPPSSATAPPRTPG
ncbi:hypothetical protein V5F01_17935 [Streptomyces sp. NRRL B-2790]